MAEFGIALAAILLTFLLLFLCFGLLPFLIYKMFTKWG